MTIKQYDVYCITKANGNEYVHLITVSAESAKKACELTKTFARVTLGRHGFTPGTKGDKHWKGIERTAEMRGIDAKQLEREARSKYGWAIYNR